MRASGSKAVIIVEDDASVSQSMERLLRLSGLTALSYGSAEALLEAGVDGAECLVVDVQLPGLGGFTLCDRLLQRGPLPPIIFITAFDEPDARRQAAKVGAAAFLAKPFTGRALLATIERAMHAADAKKQQSGDGTAGRPHGAQDTKKG